MTKVFISAGDVSGDLHGGALIRELRRRMPAVEVWGLGGEAMRAAGAQMIADQGDLAVGGFLEVLGQWGRIARAWRAATRSLERLDPDLVILIDSAGFNLPLARRVRSRTRAKVLYYIAPQIWAWRRGRLRKLVERVDRVAVIFPFELRAYRDVSLRVDFVGHPLVDELIPWRAVCDRDEACRRVGLDPARRWIALLPGSRLNEVIRHLPILIEAASRLDSQFPDLGFVLVRAPSLERSVLEEQVERCQKSIGKRVPILIESERSREVIRASDLVLLKPGTGTVESMLLQRPMVVVGRANPLTAMAVRRLLKVRWLGMPNLLAGEGLVPEWLQAEATPDRVAASARTLLDAEAAAAQVRGLAAVEGQLGAGGAAQRVAQIAEEMIVGFSA